MAKRRKLPNGTGSIERVKLTPQGKTRLNQYRARLPKSKGRKDIGFYKTYNEAMDALINYKDPAPMITFGQLYQKYTETNEYIKFPLNTQQRYQRAFERYDHLKNTNIHDITYSDLQDVIDQMELEGYYRYKNGNLVRHDYSSSSLDRLKIMINKVYTLAIKNNIIQFNPAPYLEIGGIKTKRQKKIFTYEEIDKLFHSIPTNPNARHIIIMIFTGMRTGEYMYLNRNQIDFNKNEIIDFGEKTESGRNRKMFIHPKIKDILMDLAIESQSGNIVEENGKPLKYDEQFYNNLYYPTLEKAGIEKKIPYTCRYTFATIAHNSGVSDKALQKLMGHTDFSITANSYIQDLDEYIYEELQKIQ